MCCKGLHRSFEFSLVSAQKHPGNRSNHAGWKMVGSERLADRVPPPHSLAKCLLDLVPTLNMFWGGGK